MVGGDVEAGDDTAAGCKFGFFDMLLRMHSHLSAARYDPGVDVLLLPVRGVACTSRSC